MPSASSGSPRDSRPNSKSSPQGSPNIVLILCDDMGFSDIGPYGSEIRTPNLDRLARRGVRFSQFYNCARCCPTRASLMTGLYPHKAGVGHMVGDRGVGPAYQGFLREDTATIAEALRPAGYRTWMSGKWHVGGHYTPNDPSSWTPGDERHPIPVQRGFDEHYGMLGGGGSYFNPPYMIENETVVHEGGGDYYLTDAISERAVEMIDRAVDDGRPFFGYVAYTAPHWPLHAWQEDIERYRGRYAKGGWDALRAARHEELNGGSILDPVWEISPRDEKAPAWSDTGDKEWQDLRMAVYAAQIDRMDQGIGHIMSALERHGVENDTLVMFLSDNGGCAEFLREEGEDAQPFRYQIPTADGRPIRVGNTPRIDPGPDDSFASYDLPWANASNSPFRMYKHWVHEGGIATPFIAAWPNGNLAGGVVHESCHVIDLMPTILEAAGATYPSERNGYTVQSIDGVSILPLMTGRAWERGQPLYWEHEGNCAVRDDIWKLVCRHPESWELYNMERDRTELHDLAGREPDRLRRMIREYEAWTERVGALPWPISK